MRADFDYASEGYGEEIAAAYDDVNAHLDTTAAVVALELLARGGRALELGIGTGRLALPLAAHGIDIQGIDASESMVARLRRKPGGEAIPVTMGDFADVGVDGEFSLVFVAIGTFFELSTQEDQVRCFRNVAARLVPDGAFVIEAFVPDLVRYGERGESLRAVDVGSRVRLDVSRLDRVQQRVSTRLLFIGDEGVEQFPLERRYAWPSEMDLMAQLAGMRLRERWSDWTGSPFTSASLSHVSIYESGG